MTGPTGRGARLGVAALALALLARGALAGEAQDRLFALGALDEVRTGETLVYDFSREGAYSGDKLDKIAHGEARLTVEPGEEAGKRAAVALVRDGDKLIANFDPFPADAGNPMFMVFMEEAVATMSKLTGGSSFYIRNRMREALGAQDAVEETTVAYEGREVPARVLTFQPFLSDRNADKMGPAFVDLTIRFTMSDEIPGEFARMEAVTGPDAAAPDAARAGGAAKPEAPPLMDLSLTLSKIEEG
ncbi:hypothetical protein [Amaricoccus solimangrovi]|uniref:DUF4412 domain-containing protein n=1 Tax=Amaricoccus solimangrovi TaxID=2589815 RepID=A0A501WS02_9RHOB|nr:hypothetical protein [Amaricoccus solimangrovi]TPE52148.1 hypothetical protein FJM51_06900 [Amaricoccus solimangrovi]